MSTPVSESLMLALHMICIICTNPTFGWMPATTGWCNSNSRRRLHMCTITIITSITINCGRQEGFLRPVAMPHHRIQLVMLQRLLLVIRRKTLDIRMVGKHQC